MKFFGPKGRICEWLLVLGLKAGASTAVPLARDRFAGGLELSDQSVRVLSLKFIEQFDASRSAEEPGRRG